MTNANEFLENNKVIIPKIQRDYAHGRDRKEESEIKNNLLDNLISVLSDDKNKVKLEEKTETTSKNSGEKEIILNYIYGVSKDDSERGPYIILIDGQQRITTLYLLKMFIEANTDKRIDAFSSNLSYETRETSKKFCEFMTKSENLSALEFSKRESISERLYNKKGFFVKWRNDPTVKSMLNVLDSINKKVDDHTDFHLWKQNFKNIKFSFISLDGFKREEELYSAMNGRGKQLTQFERIKPELIKKVSDEAKFSGEINDGWLPSFWEYSRKKGNGDITEAKGKHDSYMFNFFSFIVTMLYVQSNIITQKNSLPPTIEMVRKLSKNDMEFLRFSMNKINDIFEFNFSDYIKIDDVEINNNEENSKYIILPDENKKLDLDFVFSCCKNGSQFSRLAMILLWAYIKFKYNEDKSNLNGHSLQDYFILSRDLYADFWDSNSPKSLNKTPNEVGIFKAVYRFKNILEGIVADDTGKGITQFTVFTGQDQDIYEILNNPLTRGRSTNLKYLLDVKRTRKEINTFKENLSALYKNAGTESFKMLKSKGYQFFVNQKDEKRFYIPYSKTMLKSLFSLSSWTSSISTGNNYLSDDFISCCCNDKLENIDESELGYDEWEYYIKKYDRYFCENNLYCSFKSEKNEPGFTMEGIYGERASSWQTVSPFLFAAYCLKNDDKDVSVKKCIIMKAKREIVINEDDSSSIIFKIDGNSFYWDKRSDFVEFIKEHL